METQTRFIKILIIEDEKFWHDQVCTGLKDQPVELLYASNMDQARELFAENDDVNILVVNARSQQDESSAIEFITEVRSFFTGHITACSSDCNHADALVKAGCGHKVIKSRLIDKLLELVNIILTNAPARARMQPSLVSANSLIADFFAIQHGKKSVK